MKRLLIPLFCILLSSCTPTVVPVKTDQLPVQDYRLFTRKVGDSTIAYIRPSSDFFNQPTIFGIKNFDDRNSLDLYCERKDMLRSTIVISYDFPVTIPRNSFIVQSKLSLYLLKSNNGHYDDQLSLIKFFRHNDNGTGWWQNPIKPNVDFTAGWFIVDLTREVSDALKSGKSLKVVLDFGPADGVHKEVRFASSRMGDHVAPKLFIEYIPGK